MAITREMLFPLAFYKKAKFNGSKGKMCYRIEKSAEEDGDKFLLTIWEGPECYDAAKGEKTVSKYPFSDAGMEQIMELLNKL